MEFSENNVNMFRSWANALHLPIHNNFKSLLVHHNKIFELINSKYKNENSKKTYLSALAKLFKVLKGSSSYLYRKYSKLSVQLQKQIEHNNLSQEVSERRKQNYLTFDDLIKKREELKELFLQNPNDPKINNI